MKKLSNKGSTVKFQKRELEEKIISEESLLSQAMGMFAAKVLQDAVNRITTEMTGVQSWGSEVGYVQSGFKIICSGLPKAS